MSQGSFGESVTRQSWLHLETRGQAFDSVYLLGGVLYLPEGSISQEQLPRDRTAMGCDYIQSRWGWMEGIWAGHQQHP